MAPRAYLPCAASSTPSPLCLLYVAHDTYRRWWLSVFPRVYLDFPEHKPLWSDLRSFVMDTPKGTSVLFAIALERVCSFPDCGWWQRFLSWSIAYKIPTLPAEIGTSGGLSHRREEREQQSLLNFSLGLGTVRGDTVEPLSLEICKMRILLSLNGPQSYPPHHQRWAGMPASRGKWLHPRRGWARGRRGESGALCWCLCWSLILHAVRLCIFLCLVISTSSDSLR